MESELYALSVTAEKHRRLLSAGNKHSITVRGTRKPSSNTPQLSLVLDSLLSAVPKELSAPWLAVDEETLKNLRGRPAETFPSSSPENPLHERERRVEELAYAEGTLALTGHSEQEEEHEKESPFRFLVLSRFDHFDNHGGIIHHTILEKTPRLEELSSIAAIPRLDYLHLHQFRLGLELYRSRFLGSVFGVVPVVFARFFWEMSESRLYLLLPAL